MSEQKDYIDITYILASSVPNLNGALFTKDELEIAKDSIVNQPLIIVPDFNNLPTGHSVEDFPKLGFGAVVVGTHISSEIVEEDKITHLKTTARVWKIRYPEIATMLLGLHASNNLKFSMEAKYANAKVEGGVRSLKGVSFIGSAVVDNPANPYSISLEVASKMKEGSLMEEEVKIVQEEIAEEEEVKKCPECNKPLDECTCDKEEEKAEEEKCPECGKPLNECECKEEKAEEEPEEKKCPDCGKPLEECTCEKEKAEIEILKASLETANAKIAELEAELAQINEAQKLAELEAMKEKRFSEISEFIDFTEEEIAEAKEKYAKLDEEVFSLVLETAKRNRKVEKEEEELKELASDIKLNLKPKRKGYLDGLV